MAPTRILVLEDEAPLREMFRRYLERAGFQVETACNLQEGRQRLGAASYDVLLCDMRLPDGNGMDLLQEFRDRLKADGTQVVVVSAEPRYSDLTRELGVEFYLTKPISLYMLKTLIQRLTAA